MSSRTEPLCPICKTPIEEPICEGVLRYFECRRCGYFNTDHKIANYLPEHLMDDPQTIAKLSHFVFQNQKDNVGPLLSMGLVNKIITSALPTVPEQRNNLILWLGDNTIPGTDPPAKKTDDWAAVIGTVNAQGVRYLKNEMKKADLIEFNHYGAQDQYIIWLTYKGWELYYELKRKVTDSLYAFMAMSFRHPDVYEAYEQCFKLAVDESGFKLRDVREEQPAGLIDDHIIARIRSSRFIIADLSYANDGAYWEAGFAEGLGIPVIYTCKKSFFDDKVNGGTHFDTNHRKTILWEADWEKSKDDLIATIQATLPSIAKMPA